MPEALAEAEGVLSPEGRQSIDMHLPPQRRRAPAQRTPPANVRCLPLPPPAQLLFAWTRQSEMCAHVSKPHQEGDVRQAANESADQWPPKLERLWRQTIPGMQAVMSGT